MPTAKHPSLRRRPAVPFCSLFFKTIIVTAVDFNVAAPMTADPMDVSEIINQLANQTLVINTTALTVSQLTIALEDPANETTANDSTTESTRGSFFFRLDQGIMSREDYDLVRDLRSKIGLPLALLGCVLNAFAVIVYARMPVSFVNRFLIGLQILDTLFLLCTIYPFFLILIHGPDAGHTKSYQYYAKYVNNYLYVSFQRANVFCTAVLSVNRCIVMLAPFNQFVKRLFKHPIRIIATTQVITLISTIYSVFKIQVVPMRTYDGSEQYTLTNTDAYKSHKELFVNLRLCNSFIFTYIPAIGSFIANVCMIVGLLMVSRKKAKSDDPESKKFFRLGNQKTVVVLVYSGVSLVLLMPFMSVSILERVVPGFAPVQKEHYLFISTGSIVALCDITRSTMGFFVFLGLSRVFRETFIAFILRRNLDKNAQGGDKATVTTSKPPSTVS